VTSAELGAQSAQARLTLRRAVLSTIDQPGTGGDGMSITAPVPKREIV